MLQFPRVGLYIKFDTRSRLNVYKARLAMQMGHSVSHDEAIDHLLDLAGAEPHAVEVNGASVSAVQRDREEAAP